MAFKQILEHDLVVRARALAGKYTFAAVVVGMIAIMVVWIAGKDIVGLVTGGGGQQTASAQGGGQGGNRPAGQGGQGAGAGGGQQGAAGGAQRKAGGPGGAGPGAGAGGAGGAGGAPLVNVGAVQKQVFSDSVRALGTAQARESITVTSKVSDVIRRLNFESGQHVRRGTVLVELANTEQIASLNEARAQLEVDKRAYARYKELYDKGFSPKARMDEAEATLARSQAQVDAESSRIADRTIRAPFDGIVGLRTASPGMLATPGTALATLDDTSVIKLDFDVPEAQLSKMRKGTSLVAKTAAYPDVDFEGKIDQVDSRVNATTRTVRVRALLPNPSGRLRQGMLMTVEVLSNRAEALAVPDAAIIEEGATVSVYRIARQEGRASVEKVEITAGRRQNGQVEVLGGVDAGDEIVVGGTLRVRPGQPVRIENAEADGQARARPAASQRRS